MLIALKPLPDPALIFCNALSHEIFGCAAVGVSRRCRVVGLAAQAITEVPVRSANVFLQGVSAM
jgi:hypothetical protein